MIQNIISSISKQEIESLNYRFLNSNPQEIIKYFLDKYSNKITLASSLSIEDQILTDMIHKLNPEANIFTLDTGRLPTETYELIDITNKKYNNIIEILSPNNIEIQEYVNRRGINAFYDNADNRKLCCKIRKVNVLQKALVNVDAWFTGLRKEQSDVRGDNSIVEIDVSNHKLKINPLSNWSEKEVWDYISTNDLPYNSLYDKSYKSIGCAPCSKAVGELEHPRNGRWWWENPETKECGLHIK